MKQSIGDYDEKSMASLAKKLGQVADGMKGIAESMKLSKIDKVSVKYAAEVRRALKTLPKFVHAGEEAVVAVQLARGDFGSENETESSPGRKSTKGKAGKASARKKGASRSGENAALRVAANDVA